MLYLVPESLEIHHKIAYLAALYSPTAQPTAPWHGCVAAADSIVKYSQAGLYIAIYSTDI